MWLRLWTFTAAVLAVAQPLQPVPAGDPEVFFSFLVMGHAILGSVSGSKTGSSSVGQSGAAPAPNYPALVGLLNDIGMGQQDFALVESAYQALQGKLNALQAQAAAYSATHASGADGAVLQAFADRRTALIRDAYSGLRAQMSQAGFASLSQFLGGKFRQAFHRVPVKSGHQ